MARNGNFGKQGKGLGIVYSLKKTFSSKGNKASNTSSSLHTYTNSYHHSKLSAKESRRREHLSRLPKSRGKRILWYLNPKNSFSYWLGSKEGRKRLLRYGGYGLAGLLVLTVGTYAYFRQTLPSPDKVNSRVLAQTTKFYDSSGKKLLFEVYGDKNRTVVKGDEISQYMRDATVAIEDKDFYKHGGFSIKGITRAFFGNLFSREITGGGSTITQQYIKNALLTNEQVLTRKIKELILSIEIERLYTKDEILTAYLNEIPFGSMEYGVEAASKSFFDKSAKDLTIDEAAMLAALPQAPSLYSPYNKDTSLLEARQDTVIDRMNEQGYITDKQAKEAKEADTLKNLNRNRNRFAGVTAPHFVLEAQKELEKEYGAATVNQSGWKVITSLDLKLQKTTEKVVKDNIGLVEGVGADNLAITMGDQKTGHIKAMVGSRDFDYPEFGAFNAATAPRQPGSSFKPYAYAELFETGKWSPGSVLYDLKTDFGNYTPTNFNKFEQNGPITIRRALGRSLNIPAVKALHIAGIDNVIDQAKSQGISDLNDRELYGLALVLGAGEVKLADHVTGYEAFANGGTHYKQSYVKKITSPGGETIWDNTKGQNEGRVLDESAAYEITSILSDRSVRTGVLNGVNVNAAVKTGTTSNVKDLWTMGYSDHITAGVWVGNHDNKEMSTSSSLAIAPIWVQLMNEAHAKMNWQSRDFKKPEGIKNVSFDSDTGKAPTGATKRRHTDIAGKSFTVPKSGRQTSYEIDKISGKLATNCTPDSTREKVSGGGLDAEIPDSDPLYDNWAQPIRAYANRIGRAFGSTKPTEKDDVHKCSDKEPSVSNISITPSGSQYTIKANVSKGTHPLKSVSIIVNGQKVYSKGARSSGVHSTTVTGKSGNNTVRVTVQDEVGYSGEANSSFDGESITAISPSGGSVSSPVTFRWNGGSSPFTVQWKGASSGSSTSFSNQKTQGGLSSGNYQWRVTDDNGLSSTWRSFTVN